MRGRAAGSGTAKAPDELRRTGELGNLDRERLSADYEGVALTLVDALTTLAVMGNASEFAWAARWLSANVRPDACRPCASAMLMHAGFAFLSRQPDMHAQAMPQLPWACQGTGFCAPFH